MVVTTLLYEIQLEYHCVDRAIVYESASVVAGVSEREIWGGDDDQGERD
jgi:hypothetical protein